MSMRMNGAGVVGSWLLALSVGAGAATGEARTRPTPEPAADGTWPLAAETTRVEAVPGRTFRESLSGGGQGPEMVVVPAGGFRMGCLSNDEDCSALEKPVHEVMILQPFALSVHEVTFEDYDRFTYPNKVDDAGWGRDGRPVINVTWNDAQDYVEWLSAQTDAEYRLPSASEWEYAARAGTTTKYSWGDAIGSNRANCFSDHLGFMDQCRERFRYTAPVGSFRGNGFGLHDMPGNVAEWVADCWNESYVGAPSDGGAWLQGDCSLRVYRGGDWRADPWFLRAAYRFRSPAVNRYDDLGFRVARTLTP